MLNYILKNKSTSTAIVLSILLYCAFGYETNRSNFYDVLLKFSALFLLFIYLYRQNLSWKSTLCLGLVFRSLLLFSLPNLSQDFFRFIWDGRMVLNGYNPYLYLPEDFLNGLYVAPNQAEKLVNGMQELNASHYSNYPPLNQLCFAIAAFFSSKSIIGSVVIMRLLLILADIGTVVYGRKILSHINLNPNLISLYLLNPLIIIELTGNLHFEGLMIFLLAWSVYMLIKQKWIIAAIGLGLSISLKLLPLLFLPLFIRYFKFKKLIIFYAIVLAVISITFLPFLSENLINNYSKTLTLWFGDFEFNGSFYLLARHIGYELVGYNTIKTITKITPILVVVFVLLLSIQQKKQDYNKLLKFFVLALSVYFFTATTVHPWYLAMLLFLGILANFKYPLIWSFTIILSYSFYHNDVYETNYVLTLIEYGLVLGLMSYELTSIKPKNT